jgi:hypothetical protein
MSALVHHRRHSSLNKKEVERLFELGRAILVAAGVKPQTSRIANLHGDLHRVIAQIYWEEGDHWGSTLELLRARSLGFSSEQNSEEFDHLALAIRYERLGMLNAAENAFAKLNPEKLNEKNRDMAAVRHLRILRLLSDKPRFEALFQSAMKLGLSADAALDLEFERLLFAARETDDYLPLFSAVRKGKSHYQLHYILEARLVSLCLPTLKWIEEFPRVDALRRRVEFKKAAEHYLMGINRGFDTLMDDEFQNAAKIPAAFQIMLEARSIPSTSNELLCIVACYRWFSRRKLHEFADLVRQKYAQMSLIATDGATKDCLGLLQDLTPE